MNAARTALRSLPAQAALFAVAYFALARAGLAFATHPDGISPVWPASGLYLGVLLVTSRRRWPAFVPAAFVADLAAQLAVGSGAISVGISGVTVLEGLLAALVAAWLGGRRLTLTSVRQIVALVLGGAGVATALGGLCGAAVLGLGAGEPFWHSWLVWWSSDAIGMLAVAPLICAAFARRAAPPSRRQLVETTLLLAGLALSSSVVFLADLEVHGASLLLPPVLCLSFLLCLAWRSGAVAAAAGSLLLSGVAVLFTVHGRGPFATPGLGESHQHLFGLHLFLAVSVVTALALAAAVSERQRGERERAELEHRLAQSQRLESVGQLAGGIAHDFNNLLTVILHYASFVRGELPEGGSLRGDVEEIERAAARAAALTQQLLVFSRREPTKPEFIDLNAVVADTEKLLRRTIGEDIELRTKLAAGLPPATADRGQVEQVLVNLAVNARDAMPQGGTLTIETATRERAGQASDARGRSVSLAVTDTGSGMSEEVAAQAFEPFFTTKPRHLGSGLGLATVYGIVAQAGGELALDSAPGRGTTVQVSLPAAEETPIRGPVPDTALPRPAAGKEVILLVEDEPAVLEASRRILARDGHTVIAAGSPEEALAEFAKFGQGVGLLLTDVVMPQMSGKELARRMQQSEPRLRVLYMSGYTDDIVSRHGVVASDIPVLQKPFAAHTLLAAVQEVIQAPTD